MRCLFVLFFCLILDAAYGDAAPWRQVNAASSSSDDKSFFYLNNGSSYECNPVYRKGTFSFADGAELQTLYGDNYKCVKGWPDEWQKQQTNWCEKSQITTLSVSGARYCVYQDGAEQRCRVQGGNFVEDGAWPRGCLMASCDGNRFFADGKCQERKCGDSPEETVLENQECAPNVITDSNAASCTKTCTYKENPNRMVWVNSISECKQNYRPSDDKRSCVRTIGPGDNCAANDLPQFATAGKYNSGLKCVATKCKAGTYLVVSSAGASQGWCVADSYCQSVKKMDAEYKLTIIDGEKTDLTCVAPVAEGNASSDAENTSTPTQETVTDTAVVAAPVEDGGTSSTTDDGVTSPTNVQDTTVVSDDETAVDDVVAVPGENPQVNSLQAQQESQNNIDKLKDSAKSAKDREQSDANKLLGAAGIGATGIGGMMLASGAAEQDADADAENAMRAYLATFTCSYGNGKNVRGGDVDVELPGGNDLIALYAEYVALANDLKVRKEALGMRPGIESEPILNAATSGLYDDVAIGKTGGAYASLARALTDPNSQDAKMWQEQKDETAEKKKTGAITAVVGAAGSLIGNLAINSGKNKYDKKDYENAHTNIVLKNSVTEPVVESDSEESVSNVVGNIQSQSAESQVQGMVNPNQIIPDNTAIKDVLNNVGAVTSNQDGVIIAEADFFSDNGLTSVAKAKIDEMWSQITGRVCKFEVELVSPHYKDFDKEFDIAFAKQKLLESYFVAKQKPANIQVDVLVSRRRGGGCENNTLPCPNVEMKLDCFADTDVESVASGQTVWRPLESDWWFDQTAVEGTIYQSATRGKYSEYLSKARSACNDAHGTWREDIKVYTVMKNKDGKFNTYVDATCDFGTEDKSPGSKRCANMCKKAKIECTQSGAFGYNNYTSCLIYPPDNE